MSKWQKVTTVNLLTGEVEEVKYEVVPTQSSQTVGQPTGPAVGSSRPFGRPPPAPPGAAVRPPPRQHQQPRQLSRLPPGCSTTEWRPFLATLDQWGGDARGWLTAKLRCICACRRNGQHVMVGDHLWLTGKDARMIACVRHTKDGQPVKLEEYGTSFRPKRGMKLFLVARCKIYAGGTKATLCDIEKINSMVYDQVGHQAPYWRDGMPKITNSPMWHNGT